MNRVAQNRNGSIGNTELFDSDEYYVSEDSFVRRDNIERDAEQSSECTESTDRGHEMLGHESVNADRYISASRCIFFTILCASAVLCAVVVLVLYTKEEIEDFERSFKSQSEELVFYTGHNIDNVFATFQSLSASTTSLVKRARISSNFQTPPGFIELPDINHHLGLARNTTNALAIVYTPKVLNKDYDAWINYSEEHKTWISLNQPSGPVNITPEIMPYIWQWEDDMDDNSTGSNFTDATNTNTNTNTSESSFSNLINTSTRTLRSLATDGRQQRPHDCSGDHFRRRRKLDHQYQEKIEEHPETFQIKVVSPVNESFYAPVWQMVPVPIINETHREVPIINYNLMDRTVFNKAAKFLNHFSTSPVFLDVCDQSAWFGIEKHKSIVQTVVVVPVFRDFQDETSIVGFLAATISWSEFFGNNLNKEETNEMIVVMNNSCQEIFTVSIKGSHIEILGEEDLHDPKYDDMKIVTPFASEYNRKDDGYDGDIRKEFEEDHGGDICIYTMIIYPTASYEAAFRTSGPLIASVLIVLVFVCTSFAFILFDCLVTRRQTKLLNTALRQNAIVNSLFPKNVQQKLMDEAEVNLDTKNEKKAFKRRTLTSLLNDNLDNEEIIVPMDSKPIADLFPKTTIMFADISGFTAWSSIREPEAVFTLLETIYRAFDGIAKRRRVFKVEVVGDCYVAVCGLPNPRKDHFAVMCRFAQDCLSAMQIHTKELEVTLGPDTGDLALRVGLHSGPVVAGVLRGEKSRFQLFGDTMNTASRMESTGVPNRIHLSQATADLLIEQGKGHWIVKRQEKVKAKGKGELTTYFLLSIKNKSSDGTLQANKSLRDEVVLVNQDKGDNYSSGAKRVQQRNRVADWVVEMLGKLLKEMVAKRKLNDIKPDSRSTIKEVENLNNGDCSRCLSKRAVIDEVVDCLDIPVRVANRASIEENIVPLDQEVIDELQDYVYSVASIYRNNAFHNFEHASHVSMSCIKLLNRISSRDDQYEGDNDNSYDICSDPLTSFSIVFSALIHDIDHTGAPNMQLVKEHAPVAATYKNKSVAEQNSIDIGWSLLMEHTYANLRRHIYTTVSEFRCFRQMVVNCVMATDIVDKNLIKARNQRWDLAFNAKNITEDDRITSIPSSRYKSVRQANNRRVTVVIEHLIQLSDVAHTMQHWHIYRRWNERLFEESYVAYAECRAEKNPADNWYQGELGFYDFYIIPLANKIKQCQVFGVSSDEYLSYALQNRKEWEERGKEVVEEMAKKYETIHHAGISRQLLQLENRVGVSGPSQTSETRSK